MKTNEARFFAYVASIFFAAAANAGVMMPVPGDPVTIDGGKVGGTLLDSYLAHPDLTKNRGICKWVQRNIGAFGGDAAKVTLIGQSAGAMSINETNRTRSQ